MRTFLVAITIACALPTVALATDCSTVGIHNGDIITTKAISMMFQNKLMSCVDMSKLKIVPDPDICATSIVTPFTIFTICSRYYTGDNTMIAVKGGDFSEGSFLPRGVKYRYLGGQRFTKPNGFPIDIPVIEVQ